MSDCVFLGLNQEGDRLILRTPDGKHVHLVVDDQVRAAVRRDRTTMEKLRASASISPRDIQALIRCGHSPEDVAADTGTPLEYVDRFASAVLLEREHMANKARRARVGREFDAPTLFDLVVNRLATRDVDPLTIEWDAAKSADTQWIVSATWPGVHGSQTAHWRYDTVSKQVAATDEGARAITEAALPDQPIARRHLSAVSPEVFDVEAPASLPTEAVLDDLAGRRGLRQAVLPPDEEDEDDRFEGFGPPAAFSSTTAPQGDVADGDAQSDRATDTAAADTSTVATTAAKADPPPELPLGIDESRTTTKPLKKERPAMPSWDEIVFGSRADS